MNKIDPKENHLYSARNLLSAPWGPKWEGIRNKGTGACAQRVPFDAHARSWSVCAP